MHTSFKYLTYIYTKFTNVHKNFLQKQFLPSSDKALLYASNAGSYFSNENNTKL